MTFENILSLLICLLYVWGLISVFFRPSPAEPELPTPEPEPPYDVTLLLEYLPHVQAGYCMTPDELVLMPKSYPSPPRDIYFVNLPRELGVPLMLAQQEMWALATSGGLLDVDTIERIVFAYTRKRKLALLNELLLKD